MNPARVGTGDGRQQPSSGMNRLSAPKSCVLRVVMAKTGDGVSRAWHQVFLTLWVISPYRNSPLASDAALVDLRR